MLVRCVVDYLCCLLTVCLVGLLVVCLWFDYLEVISVCCFDVWLLFVCFNWIGFGWFVLCSVCVWIVRFILLFCLFICFVGLCWGVAAYILALFVIGCIVALCNSVVIYLYFINDYFEYALFWCLFLWFDLICYFCRLRFVCVNIGACLLSGLVFLRWVSVVDVGDNCLLDVFDLIVSFIVWLYLMWNCLFLVIWILWCLLLNGVVYLLVGLFPVYVVFCVVGRAGVVYFGCEFVCFGCLLFVVLNLICICICLALVCLFGLLYCLIAFIVFWLCGLVVCMCWLLCWYGGLSVYLLVWFFCWLLLLYLFIVLFIGGFDLVCRNSVVYCLITILRFYCLLVIVLFTFLCFGLICLLDWLVGYFCGFCVLIVLVILQFCIVLFVGYWLLLFGCLVFSFGFILVFRVVGLYKLEI